MLRWFITILLFCGMAWSLPPDTGYDLATPGNTVSITDFSYMLDLSSMSATWWSTAEDVDPTKGRIYLNDGTTQCACDWIDYDHASETGFIRFLYPGATGTTPSSLRIYPPVTANSVVAESDTYGSDNAYDTYWEGYWPLDETSGVIYDRTSNSLDGTITAATSTSTSVLGNAYNFSGNDEWISFAAEGSSPATGQSALTVLMWADMGTNITKEMMAEDGTGYSNNAFYMYSDDGEPLIQIYTSSGQNNYQSPTLLVANTYTHLGLVWESASPIKLYRDSAQVTDGAAGGSTQTGTLYSGDSDFLIGGRPVGSPPTSLSNDLEGKIDEYQIHSIARSANWIATEYDQTEDNATFWGTPTWTTDEYILLGTSSGVLLIKKNS